jgi:CheY-like chemotaxis protein
VVADTGEGMDTATQARVFEPFFTTKTQGRGTGLGLSTVYGIVKQSGGWIWVKSEPGQGTTFTIDFPLSGKSVTAAATAAPVLRLPKPSASETILLVEDQSSGEDALSLAARHSGTIHLLLTDVVMPGLSGRQVAERLSPARGDTKVLFMSGYTDNVIAQRGVLDPGYAFISKPFTPQTLAHKVRQVLDLN